jgi:hypothetical protein
MTIPRKDGFALTYLGAENTVGWPGYEFFRIPRLTSGFISAPDPGDPKLSEGFFPNYEAFPDYPTTTPDNIVVMQSTNSGAIDGDYYFGSRVYLKHKKSHMNSVYPAETVDSMYPPLHPNGEPFEYSEDVTSLWGAYLYPRWSGESPYDWWNTTVATPFWPYFSGYNPQSQDYIYDTIGGSRCYTFKKSEQYNGLSTVLNLGTSEYEQVQYNPQNSSFNFTSSLALMVDSRLCCFNDGAVISGIISFKKASFTLTPTSGGEFGYYSGFNITWGSVSEHSQIEWSVTLNSTSCINAPKEMQEISIPQEDGCAVFIDDFYITSVTRP